MGKFKICVMGESIQTQLISYKKKGEWIVNQLLLYMSLTLYWLTFSKLAVDCISLYITSVEPPPPPRSFHSNQFGSCRIQESRTVKPRFNEDWPRSLLSMILFLFCIQGKGLQSIGNGCQGKNSGVVICWVRRFFFSSFFLFCLCFFFFFLYMMVK